MPTYVYEVILDDDGEPGQVFEVVQKMSDPPLTHHPTTGQPVRRIIQAPHLAKAGSSAVLSDDNLKRTGFTKYIKTGDGSYEKTVGKGPDSISAK
ncbi:MAG: hypothetical protein JJU36_15360 [Phycisphaeraceae bacterium]|nr:hypothetical protein [Phycisphaeraceae bacterium]